MYRTAKEIYKYGEKQIYKPVQESVVIGVIGKHCIEMGS
jgi:hypothetical protein